MTEFDEVGRPQPRVVVFGHLRRLLVSRTSATHWVARPSQAEPESSRKRHQKIDPKCCHPERSRSSGEAKDLGRVVILSGAVLQAKRRTSDSSTLSLRSEPPTVTWVARLGTIPGATSVTRNCAARAPRLTRRFADVCTKSPCRAAERLHNLAQDVSPG